MRQVDSVRGMRNRGDRFHLLHAVGAVLVFTAAFALAQVPQQVNRSVGSANFSAGGSVNRGVSAAVSGTGGSSGGGGAARSQASQGAATTFATTRNVGNTLFVPNVMSGSQRSGAQNEFSTGAPTGETLGSEELNEEKLRRGSHLGGGMAGVNSFVGSSSSLKMKFGLSGKAYRSGSHGNEQAEQKQESAFAKTIQATPFHGGAGKRHRKGGALNAPAPKESNSTGGCEHASLLKLCISL